METKIAIGIKTCNVDKEEFFIFSIQIKRGGRNKKSIKSAAASVTAVSLAKSRLTANPDWPRIINPTTSAKEVIVRAIPTDLNA